MITKLMSRLLLIVIRGYQSFISPLIPARCRYYPTCSEYGKTAIQWHGPVKGGLLTLKRIASCHPLGGHGIDFVPLPLYKEIFYPLPASASSCSKKTNYYATNKTLTLRCPIEDSSNVSRGTKIIERGVYKDSSSYTARLNSTLHNF